MNNNHNSVSKVLKTVELEKKEHQRESKGKSVSSDELLFKPIILKGEMGNKIDIGVKYNISILR